ncbi:hypothetical protein [Tissierella sp.]|nr:hypothetical protein [Tissierella sp.]MDR7855574.1 hypothetical protein [Tissierella sp.]
MKLFSQALNDYGELIGERLYTLSRILEGNEILDQKEVIDKY